MRGVVIGQIEEIIQTWDHKRKCQHIVKLTQNNIEIKGPSVELEGITIDIGEYSKKIRSFYQVPHVMVALDTSQLLLCQEIELCEDDDPFKDDCRRIRLQMILALVTFQSLLSIPSKKEANKQISEWVDHMKELNLIAIDALAPVNRQRKVAPDRAPVLQARAIPSDKLAEISKFQRIDEREMSRAMAKLR